MTPADPFFPGFIFWGLFPAFALFVLGYALWMWRLEGRERSAAPPPERESDS